MRIALLTSNSLRHKYLAHALASKLDLKLVITEDKSPAITSTSHYSERDGQFIKKHFQLRESSEKKFFGKYQDHPVNAKTLQLEHGAINSPEVFNILRKAQIDLIVLFGTSIIKSKLLNAFPRKIINFHLGLSPYYKGSATNLFPYYYNQPECIGGTIHLATPQVDQGAILTQFRPEINLEDDLHDIGNKVIFKGGEILPNILEQYAKGKLIPVQQPIGGRLCRNKDLVPEILQNIYLNFEKGMINEYLHHKELRDDLKPVVDCF